MSAHPVGRVQTLIARIAAWEADDDQEFDDAIELMADLRGELSTLIAEAVVIPVTVPASVWQGEAEKWETLYRQAGAEIERLRRIIRSSVIISTWWVIRVTDAAGTNAYWSHPIGTVVRFKTKHDAQQQADALVAQGLATRDMVTVVARRRRC